MIQADAFVEAARARGFAFYSGVPCSYLTPLINYVIDAPALSYVGAANEGDAVAIAAGAALGGRSAVVMFQNSGLGNAVNPLASLNHVFRIPLLVVVTLRGEPGGAADEPQHELMGRITTRQLELLEIPWQRFPDQPAAIGPALARAEAHMIATGRPFALAMSKGMVTAHPLTRAPKRQPPRALPPAAAAGPELDRAGALRVIQEVAADLPMVATTGYTGRELCALGDRLNQFYMVGSMGCASSFGLGLALARPSRRVVVIDGDGAALMRLGAFATIGAEAPVNLVHLLLDNGMHESTGGQATVAGAIDFCALAAACGYAVVERAASAEALAEALRRAGRGPRFIHVPIKPGVSERLPRPTVSPEDVARRFRDFVEHGG